MLRRADLLYISFYLRILSKSKFENNSNRGMNRYGILIQQMYLPVPGNAADIVNTVVIKVPVSM